jgi:endonuclease I
MIKKILLYSLLLILSGRLSADAPIDYYTEAMGQTGESLKSALHHIVAYHERYSYKNVWDILQETDEDPNNADNVVLIYSRRSLPKSKHGGAMDEWNREHTWPKSHGFPQMGWSAYTDVHHLRPSLTTVNGARDVLDFDNGGYKTLPEAPKVRYDDDSWEVPNEVKGNVARGIFYMAVRYEGGVLNEPDLEITDDVNESQPGVEKIGKLSALLDWHIQDPPDEQERVRNDKVFKWQGNRNPFIDHPEWVTDIWKSVPISSNSQNGIEQNQTDQASCDDNNGSTQTGIEQCKADPASCGITIASLGGFTQLEMNQAKESIKQDCQINPASCGITDTNGSTQAGIEQCKADPAFYGIENGHATYNPNNEEIHIPFIDVPGTLGTTQVFEIYFTQISNSFIFSLDMNRIKQK